MARSKTSPKNDGPDTTTSDATASDAPAAVNEAEQAEPEVTGATEPMKIKRLDGKSYENALEHYEKHGRPPKNVSVGWETKGGATRPVFKKRS